MTSYSPPRTARRYEVRLAAELTVEGKKLAGKTRNLSIGGLCVELDRPCAEGTAVRILLFVVEDDVEAEGSKGLELDATVQWVAEGEKGYAIGVKFNPLPPPQVTLLQNALKQIGESAV